MLSESEWLTFYGFDFLGSDFHLLDKKLVIVRFLHFIVNDLILTLSIYIYNFNNDTSLINRYNITK